MSGSLNIMMVKCIHVLDFNVFKAFLIEGKLHNYQILYNTSAPQISMGNTLTVHISFVLKMNMFLMIQSKGQVVLLMIPI